MSTTTITPHAAAIPLEVTLTSPLHHGAGTAGNTSLLRTETVIAPDGTQHRVPFVSGNSVRHGLRDALAWHLASTLDLANGSLSKATVDLLWSGGAVTSTGAQTDLDLGRRMEEIFPALGLLGYAAHSDIVAGTLRVAPLLLVCAENAWRLPPSAAASAHSARGAAAFRGEEFGTRHDVAGSPVDRFLDAALAATGTTQMIYDMQVLQSGSRLSGSVSLTAGATPAHRTALGAALALWAPHVDGSRTARLGAKTAVGFGAATVSLPDGVDADLADWTRHVTDHGDAILALLAELAS